jgi:hypothetical protein
MEKPNVIPNQAQRNEADERARIAKFEAEKAHATNEIYANAAQPTDTPVTHIDAVEAMRLRTEAQLNMLKTNGTVVEPNLAENPRPVLSKYDQEVLAIRTKAEEQMKLRDAALSNNQTQTDNYHRASEGLINQTYEPKTYEPKTYEPTTYQPQYNPSAQQPTKESMNIPQQVPNIDSYLIELNQPNYNTAQDTVPLPSEGKLYRNKKPSIRVSFMTTADENILTSPNLIESGQFLSILFNRKMLEPDLRYRDLHIGDRNAIMIYLRATAYGEMYPVTLLDEDGQPFDTEINLNDLKYKKLGAEPDEEGLFHFVLPLSKRQIKFKLLTCGDVDDIEVMLAKDKANNLPVNNSSTYILQKTFVEIDGIRDKNLITEFASNITIKDAKALTQYIDKIESGIDLDITIGTPRGGSITTFLPLNRNFFWPNR